MRAKEMLVFSPDVRQKKMYVGHLVCRQAIEKRPRSCAHTDIHAAPLEVASWLAMQVDKVATSQAVRRGQYESKAKRGYDLKEAQEGEPKLRYPWLSSVPALGLELLHF
uniref:Uncharacterized protein n=1 Tax=Eutreptiella gymnastica TaxID=73025 RepID=A0A7S1IKN9_9EUGL|mmetsp:Transcript_25735/g.46486  ORF Transcript_25735/g.46486 Transcript_25735/m.46486 type:complete len:109 (+) Transcript_25735:158-484(+)